MKMSLKKYLSFILLVIMLTSINSEDPKKNNQIPENDVFPREIPNDKIYEMNDSNFNYFLHQKEFKWCVLFYLKTCGHCAKARKVINSLFQNVLDSSMRFGQIEISTNILNSIRFNSTQVPYIVIFQDGMMYEFKKYHNEANLKEFINNEKVIEDALPIPIPPKFIYVTWVMLRDGIISLRMAIQNYLNKRGYQIKLETYHIVIALLTLLGLFVLCQCWCINKCCKLNDMEDFITQYELQNNINTNAQPYTKTEKLQEQNKNERDESVPTEEVKKMNEETTKKKKKDLSEKSKIIKKRKKKQDQDKIKEEGYPNPKEGKEKPELKKD